MTNVLNKKRQFNCIILNKKETDRLWHQFDNFREANCIIKFLLYTKQKDVLIILRCHTKIRPGPVRDGSPGSLNQFIMKKPPLPKQAVKPQSLDLKFGW